MKSKWNRTFFLIGLFALAMSSSAVVWAGDNDTSPSRESVIKEISLQVSGMTCRGCESAVEQTLKAMRGVVSARANHKQAKVTVSYDSALLTPDDLIKAIKDIGYTASL